MKLDIKVIKENMNNNLFCGIKYFDTITSTNELALNLTRDESKEGLVILSEEQTRGRGRLNRNWYSKKEEGLWFSLILKPEKKIERLPLLTLIGALAVHSAINKLDIKTVLKWPNDILYKNKKLCGVLSQSKIKGSKLERAVVGIGINVNQKKFPDDIKKQAISLRIIKNHFIQREKLLSNILDNFAFYYSLYRTEKYNKIIKQWKEKMSMMDKVITVKNINNKLVYGKVVDISNKGELILKKQDGKIEKYIAGDVSINKNSLRF
ncbi:MAG: biotin--[acetyl-CoA-carboxylase] ligase [Halanaerobiales bacterium]|nr:biotin--[acetyl-CoA-carboxylase] ligase [Halanaerobiales bacterium]